MAAPFGPRRDGRRLPAALLLAALGVWLAVSARVLLLQPAAGVDLHHVDLGESLLHDAALLPAQPFYRMPIGPVLEAWTLVHLSGWRQAVVPAAFLAWLCLAVFALGATLGNSPWSGWAALAAAQPWMWPNMSPGSYKQWCFSAFVVTAAAALARWARRGGKGAAALSAALGASLLFRSPLAFFPPFLGLLALGVDTRSRGRGLRLAALVLGPYLFLLPWTAASWAAQGRLLFFENAAADPNVIAGVAGSITFAHGDVGLLADGELKDGKVMSWALGRMARQPLDYAGGVLRRVRFVFGLEPGLFLLAAWALLLRRRQAPFLCLTAFAAYFIGVHCSMALDPGHFQPLWIVLAALAAAGLLPPGPKEESSGTRAGSAAVAAVIAAAAACAALAAAALIRYAVLQAGPAVPRLERLEKAAAAHPQDGWLAFELGRARLSRGDDALAEVSLRRALELQPLWVRTRLELAWVEARLGRPRSLLTGRFSLYPLEDPHHDDYGARVEVYRAAALLRLGRRQEARRQLALALERWRAFQTFPDLAADRVLQDKLRRDSDGRFARRLEPMVSDPRDRGALLEELGALAPGSAWPWIYRASAAAETGETALAVRCLDLARALKPDPEQTRRIDEARAAVIEGGFEALFKRARAQAEQGQKAQALATLARAERLGPGPAHRLRLADAYAAVPDLRRALGHLDALPGPDGVEVLIDKARARAGLGRRKPALWALAQAEGLGPDPGQRRRIASVYAGLEEFERALAHLDALAGPDSGEIVLEQARARAGLKRKRLRLAAVHAEAGRFKLALEQLDALAGPDDFEVLLEKARARAALGLRERAWAALAQAERFAPGPRQRRALAGAYIEAGDLKSALRHLDSLPAQDAETLTLKARAHAGLGETSMASALLERAQRQASDPDQRYRIALAYQDLKAYDRALSLLRALTAAAPRKPDVLASRGISEYLTGSTDEAVRSLEGAIKLDPGFLPAYLTLGYVRCEQRRYAEAAALYRTALEKTADRPAEPARQAVARALEETSALAAAEKR